MRRWAWVLAALLGVAAVAGALLQRLDTGPGSAEVTGFAMGTYARVVVEGQGAERVIAGVMPTLDRLTKALDRFDPESDVGRLNARAGEGEVAVGEATARIMADALRIARLTGGAFDPTIGPLVDLWGFVNPTGEQDSPSQGTVQGQAPPDPGAIEAALDRVGYQGLRVDPTSGTAALERPGMVLDLGGIAKGAAVDILAEQLREAGARRAFIDLGGNLYALGRKADGSPWRVGIQHPRQSGAVIAVVEAVDRAISTSGDYQRYFIHQGTRYSHLLDPSTGYPARELASVTVLAPSGAEADGLSTALFILGAERGKALAESLPGVEAVFVDQGMNVTYTRGLEGRIEVRR